MERKIVQLTVFTPAYNRADLLPRCYESMKRQTNKNFIWMIIDDGSTDSTGKICDEYVCTDERIIVLHHEKCQGISCVRNDGINMARGRYIMFVDSDDYIAENMIEKMYYFIKNTM